jgi:MFS family permease
MRRHLSDFQRRRLTLLAMCVSLFIIQVDVTIVNVALPSIQRSLHTTPGDLEWVISAYALALAALIPVGGALGDRYGRKRIFLIGLAVFALGSMACAMSRSAAALIGFRALQSFIHGYRLAVGLGAACVLAAAVTALLGLRRPRSETSSRRPATSSPDQQVRRSAVSPR